MDHDKRDEGPCPDFLSENKSKVKGQTKASDEMNEYSVVNVGRDEEDEEEEEFHIMHSDDESLHDQSDSTTGAAPRRPRVQIDRPAFDQTHFHERFQFGSTDQKRRRGLVRICHFVQRRFARLDLCKFLLQLFPILSWLPNYQWKKNLPSDFSAGFTVAVMHIPQGMAYALLADTDPIVGIYTAFFPVIVYIIFGTSRHISIGTFAVISILASKTVTQLASGDVHFFESKVVSENITDIQGVQTKLYSSIEVITALSFMAGMFQISFYFLHLGSLCSLLSHSLIRGFTTGAAIHVFSSQVVHLLGLKVPKFNGPFALGKLYYNIFSNIGDTNLVTFSLSVCIMVSLEIYSNLLEKKISKLLRGIHFPVQLLFVLVGTIVSYYLNLEEKHNVEVVGTVKKGLPSPSLPPVELFSLVAVDAFAIAIVSYVITYSLGLLFANKHRYKISADQELLAQGLCNTVGSFFSSLPISGSLSRTSVQDDAGCKTMMTSVVSVFCLLWVLLFAGPLFQPLPNAVLAAIIVVALKGMFRQFSDLLPLFRKSPSDLMIWLVTFGATVNLGVDLGLAVGVALNLTILLYWALFPVVELLNETDYKDININGSKFHDVKDQNVFIMIRVQGGLNFCNAVRVQENVEKQVESVELELMEEKNQPKYVLLDLTGVPKADLSACLAFVAINNHLKEKKLKLIIIGVSEQLWLKFKTCGVFDSLSKTNFFPTMQDAIATLRQQTK